MNPLVPSLLDAADKRIKHPVTDLRGGDQLHFTSKALGYPKNSIQAIYGYCVVTDDDGVVFQVLAYLRPLSAAGAVAYTERTAVRWRFNDQREAWFGHYLTHLVEVDLTDYHDCLRLERQPESLQTLLTPSVAAQAAPAQQAASIPHRQAA